MIAFWQGVVKDVWGIDVTLTPLNGEFDLNFMAHGARADFVLKVMRAGCDDGLIHMQCAALAHLQTRAPDVATPNVIPTLDKRLFCAVSGPDGQDRLIWMQERLPGICYAEFTPQSLGLIGDLGHQTGQMDRALADFDHPYLTRDFKWNLTQAGWIGDHLGAITDPQRRALLSDILKQFQAVSGALGALENVAIHNDVNDYNILVTPSLARKPTLSGIIDLGDMTASPRICDLAIAGAYTVLGQHDPAAVLAALVAGYHSAYPLSAAEVDLVWPLLRMRLAVSVVISTLQARENPDDPYVTISQAPAWAFLENHPNDPGLIRARLRAVCELPVTGGAKAVLAYLESERGKFAPLFGFDLSDAPIGALSVRDSTTPQNPFHLPPTQAPLVGQEYENNGLPWLGGYHEPRLIYTEAAFRNGPWKASDLRTVHLAVDVFLPAGTPLYAPLDGVVEVMENRAAHLDYGGMIILRHETPDGAAFYTLYGHLDPAFLGRLKPGDTIAQGSQFCALGDPSQNGGWAPHVHFQLALSTDGMGHEWPGVGTPDEMYLWRALCPNPAALLNLPDAKTAYQPLDKAGLLDLRAKVFGQNLKLSYADPVMFLRGWRHHLFDEWGRPYLDAYNNVPHVGHAHPRIQAVAADQLKRMNSNTRYLHPAQTEFAAKILSKLPDPLAVCFFVNSGTEANELALRLARASTGGKDMITPEHGYHGNTTGAMDVSAYKFNAKGGAGQPDWVQLVDVADDYRGRFRRDDPDRAQKFAAQVDGALTKIAARDGKLAGWISETFPSVGGQIIPPKGYLAAVYAKIRAAGGICIADEVQTGLGRLGTYYFGFEHQGVVPDIVVLGKPIGNGHPLGVLVTTRAIADRFAQGPEYFSTFGGSTLSCRIGKEVLDIVDDEGLQEHAARMGTLLLDGLRSLQSRHRVIGDVRGIGLFVGVDLVTNRNTRAPATEIADYVLNRMRQERVLIGTEGPHNNTLKIRPPLTIDADDIDMILAKLDLILGETACGFA